MSMFLNQGSMWSGPFGAQPMRLHSLGSPPPGNPNQPVMPSQPTHPSSMREQVPFPAHFNPYARPQAGLTVHTPVTEVNIHGSIVPPETAEKIVALAVESLKDPVVFHTARMIVSHLIDENASPFYAAISEVQAIFNYIAQRMRYTRDPIGIELVYGPSEIVRQWKSNGRWSEDCDSYATVLMAFFMAIGRKCRTVIVSFDPSIPDRYEHVFVEVFVPGDPKQLIPDHWLMVDPSTAPHTDEMRKNITFYREFYP